MTQTLKSSLLYKYCKANSFSYQLLNGEIYFSQPRQLNDPTDLNPGKTLQLLYDRRVEFLKGQIKKIKLYLAELGYDIDNMSFYRQINDEIYAIRREYEMLVDGDDEPGSLPMEWAQGEMDKIKQRIKEHRSQGVAGNHPEKFEKLDKYFSELWNLEHTWWGNELENNSLRVTTEEIGVLCLTTDKKNYSMWAMYADGFRGICIGLDQKLLKKSFASGKIKIDGPIPVIYRKITLKDLLNPHFANRETSRYMYKNPNWSSEKEVRFVSLDDFGVTKVPLSCIKEIIVGNLLDSKFRQEIELALQLRNRELATKKDMLHVYQATGDSEGRVHIQIDTHLDSLVKRQEKLRKSAKRQSDMTKEHQKREIMDDDIPF